MSINKVSLNNNKNVSFKKLEIKVDSYKNWNPLALNTIVKNTEVQKLATELAIDKKDLLVEYDEYKSALDASYMYTIVFSANKHGSYRIAEQNIKDLCARVQAFQASDFYNAKDSSDRSCIRDFDKSRLLNEESFKILKEFNKSLKSNTDGETLGLKIKKIFK